MPTTLSDILKSTSARVQATRSQRRVFEQEVAASMPPPDFAVSLRAGAVSVVAEIKRRSPSAGVIAPNLDPVQLARDYVYGGAAAISVLTEPEFFGGSLEDLRKVRSATPLPILRKDFMVDPWQLYESRVLGADCILLIVAALERAQLLDLDGLAREIGLDVLVEVHNEDELLDALATGASLIGVNNRNLHTFTTDLTVSERLYPMIPQDRTMVTESGIHSREDVVRLRRCGIQAFLVGEAFMRQDEPGSALRSLFFGDEN